MAEEGEPIIVKADEVDEAGADISIISAEDATESEFNARIENRRAHDAQLGGSPKTLANEASNAPMPLGRPPMRRELSVPPPPQQPPPPAPSQQPTDTPSNTDSLSLQQLRRLVTDLPKLEPAAYAYEYTDTRSFPEEINEWFQYTEEERFILLRAKQTFDEEWEKAQATQAERSDQALSYTELSLDVEHRLSFVSNCVHDLSDSDIAVRLKGLDCLSYIAMGIWGSTAGQKDEHAGLQAEVSCLDTNPANTHPSALRLQLHWILDGVKAVCSEDLMTSLIKILRSYHEDDEDVDAFGDTSSKPDQLNSSRFSQQIEINQTLTVLYFIVEVARYKNKGDSDPTLSPLRTIWKAKGDLLVLLTKILAKLRWEEASLFPVHRVLLLFWKLILLHFGGSEHLNEIRKNFHEDVGMDQEKEKDGFITTSPLDYHLFRQEITSKYPAYEPPPPLIPIEPENNSILPPLPNHSSRRASQDLQNVEKGATANGASSSIFYQPVHIATPAPSPPPSPAGPGGKVAKKQNYQTNQNLPFLYPPLDNSSNAIGGRGSTELQSKLVAKQWEGGDVPASIQEAGQLFASRMRMSRSLQQLWDVREEFMRQERGWDDNKPYDKTDELASKDSNDSDPIDESEAHRPRTAGDPTTRQQKRDLKCTESSVSKLDQVEQYYVCCFCRNHDGSQLTVIPARRSSLPAIRHYCALESRFCQCLRPCAE